MGLLTPVAVRIGSISWLPRLLPQIVWVDEHLQRITHGRLTLLDVAGLPNLMLTVAGRRTGVLRQSPLLCVPYGTSYLVAGSNFGGPAEPAWALNLEVALSGTVRIKGHTSSFTARLVPAPEREAMWHHMVDTWPNFAKYQYRTSRTIKVFELTIADQIPSPRHVR